MVQSVGSCLGNIRHALEAFADSRWSQVRGVSLGVKRNGDSQQKDSSRQCDHQTLVAEQHHPAGDCGNSQCNQRTTAERGCDPCRDQNHGTAHIKSAIVQLGQRVDSKVGQLFKDASRFRS